jgi:drug/metabolite transporter (DMT)-like permease
MWFFLALLTAVTWGITYTCTEQITKAIDIKTYLLISCGVSTLLYGIWGWVDGSIVKDITSSNFQSVMPYLIIGILASDIACYSSVAAVKSGGASFAAIIEISYPLWVIVFTSILSGKSTVNMQTIIGGLIIFAGSLLVVKSH